MYLHSSFTRADSFGLASPSASRAPDKIKTLNAIEPAGAPPPEKATSAVKTVPRLVVWGDYREPYERWNSVRPITLGSVIMAAAGKTPRTPFQAVSNRAVPDAASDKGVGMPKATTLVRDELAALAWQNTLGTAGGLSLHHEQVADRGPVRVRLSPSQSGASR